MSKTEKNTRFIYFGYLEKMSNNLARFCSKRSDGFIVKPLTLFNIHILSKAALTTCHPPAFLIKTT